MGDAPRTGIERSVRDPNRLLRPRRRPSGIEIGNVGPDRSEEVDRPEVRRGRRKRGRLVVGLPDLSYRRPVLSTNLLRRVHRLGVEEKRTRVPEASGFDKRRSSSPGSGMVNGVRVRRGRDPEDSSVPSVRR